MQTLEICLCTTIYLSVEHYINTEPPTCVGVLSSWLCRVASRYSRGRGRGISYKRKRHVYTQTAKHLLPFLKPV